MKQISRVRVLRVQAQQAVRSERTMVALQQGRGVMATAGRSVGLVTRQVLLLAALLPLAACNNFFQCEDKAACPSTSTGTGTSSSTTTVNFAFVSYTTTGGSAVLTGYNIASGALTVVNTVTLPFIPVAMAVNAANSRLYVASVPGASSPGIYEYTIGSDGTLTLANGGSALVTDLVGAMTISPDGNYLYTLQSTGETLTQYTVNTSTGVLSSGGALTVPSLSCALAATTPVLPTCSVAVSPAENYVVASFGTLGDAVFGYGSSTGITGSGAYTSISAGTSSGDFSVAIDSDSRAYLGRTTSISVYGLASLVSSPTTYSPQTYTFASGTVPRGVVVTPDADFVYTADVGTSQITGFATGSTTALTVLSGSPYTAPTRVAALGADSKDTYLVAVGYDASAGVKLYSVASTGVLTAVASAGTSTATQYPVLVAMSH